MIATGSWDSPSFRTQVDFSIGVFPVPLPDRDHPRYGPNIYGPVSEADTGTSLAFGVVRDNPAAARALDFLHYLTSQEGNALFSRLSGWLPSVVGVDPAPEIAPFAPADSGFLPGFDFGLMNLGADSRRIFDTHLDLLYSPAGSVDDFLAATGPALPGAILSDVRRGLRQIETNSGRQDLTFLAHWLRSRRVKPDAEAAEKADQMIEAQHALETVRAWHRESLEHLASESASGTARAQPAR